MGRAAPKVTAANYCLPQPRIQANEMEKAHEVIGNERKNEHKREGSWQPGKEQTQWAALETGSAGPGCREGLVYAAFGTFH